MLCSSQAAPTPRRLKARHQFAPDKQDQAERKFKLQIRTVSRFKVGI
jgi:hypothetical protein